MKQIILIIIGLLSLNVSAEVTPWTKLISVECSDIMESTLEVTLDNPEINKYSVTFTSCVGNGDCSVYHASGSQKLTAEVTNPSNYTFSIIDELSLPGMERVVVEVTPNSKGGHKASFFQENGYTKDFSSCEVVMDESATSINTH